MDCCKTKEKKGCCDDLKKSDFFENHDEKNTFETKHLKGGNKKMDKRVTLWVVIGVLFVIALFLTFKAGAFTGVEAASIAAKTAAPSSGGMVGGC